MMYLDDTLTESELTDANAEIREIMPLTTDSLLTIIKTADWSRYTGAQDQGYATAGTTGPGAIDMRCPLPLGMQGLQPKFIEYRHVGTETWLQTGYAAVMRYDAGRRIAPDYDGYEFIPYRLTELQRAIR